MHGSANDVNKPHVRDLKIRGLGVGVDMGKSLFVILGHFSSSLKFYVYRPGRRRVTGLYRLYDTRFSGMLQ